MLCISSFAFSQSLPDTSSKIVVRPKVYYKSANLAMLLSTILPGGGQFYTQNYLKGILIGSIDGVISYYAIKHHLDYQKTGDQNHKEKRTNFLWWLASIKLFSVADAYVSANMYKFKEQQRLTIIYCPYDNKFGVGIILFMDKRKFLTKHLKDL